MKDYRILLLDMDRTFFDFPKTERRAFFQATSELGLSMTEDMYHSYEKINLNCWERLERGELDREQLKRERFLKLFAKYQLSFSGDLEELNQHYYVWLSRGGDLYSGAWDLWKNLHDRYRLCVVTNGNPVSQQARLEAANLWHMTDGFVASGEIGKSKPDPVIYFYAMEKMGDTVPDHYLVVGDSYSADMQGAFAADLDALWYRPLAEPITEQRLPTYIAQSYSEIASILLP
jgi:2-haloacid dehalogenase